MKVENNFKQCIKAIEEAKLKALETIGLFVEGETKLRTPVDTGNLRNSYNHKTTNNDSVVIGTNTEYAEFVELGTSKQQAQAHLYPAYFDNKEEIKQIVENEFSKI